jgi:hypothetical protein
VDPVSDVIEHRWTADQLVESGQASGYQPTPRLVADWASKGLLDRPTKRGLGRGKGTIATWPDAQRNLFMTLLHQRSAGATVPTLCNVPVAIWLHWDDFVPLRQARRALSTWVAARVPERSWHRARRSAQQLVQRLRLPPDTKALQTELVEVLAKAAFNGTLDRGMLRGTLAPLDEAPRQQPNGGAAVQPTCGDVLARIEAHFAAVEQRDRLPDNLYAWARISYRTMLGDYLRGRPIVEPPSPRVALSPAPAASQLFSRACLDLLTIIGLRLTAPAFVHLNDSPREPET